MSPRNEPDHGISGSLAIVVQNSSTLVHLPFNAFETLNHRSSNAMLVCDKHGCIVYANRAALQIERSILARYAELAGDNPADTNNVDGMPAVFDITWGNDLAKLLLFEGQLNTNEIGMQSQSLKMEALGRIVSTVAHDFRNVAAAFQSGLRVIGRRLIQNASREELIEVIEEMQRRAKNAEMLAGQITNFSRRNGESLDHIDLNSHLLKFRILLDQILGSAIKLELELGPTSDLLVNVDQLDAALLNLVINSRDAIVERGRIIIATDIVDADESECKYIRLTVSDTGVGMDSETKKHAHEPYFTNKPTGKGTGLGLSQVQRFVSSIGGFLQIDSEVGKGTHVHLFLPNLVDIYRIK